MRISTIDWLLLAALSVLWGGSFFFAEVALRELGPMTVVAFRVGIAALALYPLARLLGHSMPMTLAFWTPFFVMGALNNLIPFSLIVWGQTRIDSGLAAIINAMTPMFGVVLAHVLTSDGKMTPSRVAGVLIGFGGLVAMIGPGALRGLGADLLGQAAILGAALSYAFAGLYGRRFRAQPLIVVAGGQVTASALMAAPIALWLEGPPSLTALSPDVAASLVAVGLASTALAYVIFFRILRSAGATNLMLVTLMIPPTAVLLGVAVLGESLSSEQTAGMALICFGLLVIDGRLTRALRLAASRS